MKRIISLLLSLLLIIQIIPMTVFAESNKTEDSLYKIVTIGDSITAGCSLSGSNYNSPINRVLSSENCYGNILADAVGHALGSTKNSFAYFYESMPAELGSGLAEGEKIYIFKTDFVDTIIGSFKNFANDNAYNAESAELCLSEEQTNTMLEDIQRFYSRFDSKGYNFKALTDETTAYVNDRIHKLVKYLKDANEVLYYGEDNLSKAFKSAVDSIESFENNLNSLRTELKSNKIVFKNGYLADYSGKVIEFNEKIQDHMTSSDKGKFIENIYAPKYSDDKAEIYEFLSTANYLYGTGYYAKLVTENDVPVRDSFGHLQYQFVSKAEAKINVDNALEYINLGIVAGRVQDCFFAFAKDSDKKEEFAELLKQYHDYTGIEGFVFDEDGVYSGSKWVTSIGGVDNEYQRNEEVWIDSLKDADLVSILLGGNDCFAFCVNALVSGLMREGTFDMNPLVVMLLASVLPMVSDLTYEDIANILEFSDIVEGESANNQQIINFFKEYQKEDSDAVISGLAKMMKAEDIIAFLKILDKDILSGKILDSVDNYMFNFYEETIKGIHRTNPDAEIVLMGMFNAFGNSVNYDANKDGKTGRYTLSRTVDQVIASILPALSSSIKSDSKLAETASQLINSIADKLGFKNTAGEVLDDAQAQDALMYSILHTIAGNASSEATYAINAKCKAWAKEYNEKWALEGHGGCIFVDTENIVPNKADTDPHPYEEGHKAIADKLIKELIAKANYNSNTKEGAEALNNNKAEFVIGTKVSLNVPIDAEYILVNDTRYSKEDYQTGVLEIDCVRDNYLNVYAQMPQKAPINLLGNTAIIGDKSALGGYKYLIPLSTNLGTKYFTSSKLLTILGHSNGQFILRGDETVSTALNSVGAEMDIYSTSNALSQFEYFTSIAMAKKVVLDIGTDELYLNYVNRFLERVFGSNIQEAALNPFFGLKHLNDIELLGLTSMLEDGFVISAMNDSLSAYKANMTQIAAELNKILLPGTKVIILGLKNPVKLLKLSRVGSLRKGVNSNFADVGDAIFDEANDFLKKLAESNGFTYIDTRNLSEFMTGLAIDFK